MTRAFVFLSVAMVAASLGLFAQDISGGARNSKQSNNTQHAVEVTGCVNTSASGAYTLTDDHGTTYALSGSTDGLENRNSQPMEITGEQGSGLEVSGNASIPKIQVTSTKLLARHCHAGADLASKTAGTAGAVAENGGQLPQTSTILPLLGLIGLGSLVAGFFARQ